MEECDLRAEHPRVLVPLDESGRHSLLHHNIDLLGNLLRSNGDSGICRINIVGSEDSGVASGEGIGLHPLKLVTVVGNQ